MTLDQLFNALAYEIVIRLARRFSYVQTLTLFQLIVNSCRPDWAEWKAEFTMRQVDEQTKKLQSDWDKKIPEEKTTIAMEKAQKLFPKAKISLVEGDLPGIMIEHDAPASLGGPLQIRAMY